MDDGGLVLQLGVGQVRWTMPTTVQRLEVVSLWHTEGTAHAGAYALAAGLPPRLLAELGLHGRPSQDMARVVDAVLTRQGCTVLHAQRACSEAFAAILKWYADATADKRGNSAAGPGGPQHEANPAPTAESAS